MTTRSCAISDAVNTDPRRNFRSAAASGPFGSQPLYGGPDWATTAARRNRPWHRSEALILGSLGADRGGGQVSVSKSGYENLLGWAGGVPPERPRDSRPENRDDAQIWIRAGVARRPRGPRLGDGEGAGSGDQRGQRAPRDERGYDHRQSDAVSRSLRGCRNRLRTGLHVRQGLPRFCVHERGARPL